MYSLWLSTNPCEISAVLKIILFIKKLLQIVCFIVPIGLILMVMYDLFRCVISSREDDMKKKFQLGIKRIIYCMFIFLVPYIVNLVVSMVNDAVVNLNASASSCSDNINNIAYYEELEKIKKEQEKAKLASALEASIAKEKEKEAAKEAARNAASSSASNKSTSGNVSGQKYNLTDSQLRGLAKVAQEEQGTAVGAAAEASLMANRFELYGSGYGTGGDGLCNYVANSGWFSNASYIMNNTSGLSSEVLAAVKEVLVLGKRTLPLYVDEHDCIDCGDYGFDIVSIVIDGKTISDSSGLLNKSNYKQDKTVINNRYGSVYTFYTFPTDVSDPFGYTKDAFNKVNNK